MRFDVPAPCFFGGVDFIKAIETVSALGFDAIETYDWRSLDLDAVRNACVNSGVEMVSMCTTEFRLTDKSYSSLWLEGLRDSCRAALQVGTKKLITQVGNDTGEERAAQHSAIVATLKAAVPILEASGVTVMIEPLNVLYDHKGYYLTSSAEAFDIVREVGSEFVKVVFDIYHQQVTEGNIINNIRDNLDCIAHLHCAGHPGRRDLQLGENDYGVIFAQVDAMGYRGCCGLEYNPVCDSQQSLKEFRRIYLKEEIK